MDSLLNGVHHTVLSSGFSNPEWEIFFAITAYPWLLRHTFPHFGVCEIGGGALIRKGL
jgi:hypothetical protein